MNRALTLFAFSLAFSSLTAIAQGVPSQPTTPEAQVRLGNDYLEKHDYCNGHDRFRKAADRGNAAAENNVGWLDENGFGVTQNHAEALSWHRKAADTGSIRAQENLGRLYQDGLGTKQDYNEALVWYLKAADQGSTSGMRSVGWFYNKGWGVKQDYAEASK